MNSLDMQQGGMMIEVLVTIAITVTGMYGLLGVQGQLMKTEMESYQRTQAIMLLEDMASRLDTNRGAIDQYATTGSSPAYTGVGISCDTAPSSVQERDTAEWCEALQGASEVTGTDNSGAMIGGRGCVEEIGTGSGQYMVTVVWQGLTPIAPPPASVSCGANLYNQPAGSACVADRCRRFATTMVRIPNL